MGRPLTFYGLNALRNELIKDVTETWGHGLDDLTPADALWLIARIAHETWQEEPSNLPPSSQAEEVVDRIHELSYSEKLSFLQAIIYS